MKLLLHASTGYQLEALKNTSPQAVLITGAMGSGKATLARELVQHIIGLDVASYPYYLEINPVKQSIGIEAIRELKTFLQRKTTGTGLIRRAVVINDGHTMGVEAQNALLKNLEEPPADTIIIITASDVTKLLPTIRSRSLLLQVLPVSLEQATAYYRATADLNEITSTFYMSGGRAGLMSALLSGEQEHPLVAAITAAKDLLKMDTFHRLARVDTLSKQKDDLPLLLTGMQRVLGSGLKQATANKNTAQTKSFYHSSRAVFEAQTALGQNVNPKLLLTNLFLHF